MTEIEVPTHYISFPPILDEGGSNDSVTTPEPPPTPPPPPVPRQADTLIAALWALLIVHWILLFVVLYNGRSHLAFSIIVDICTILMLIASFAILVRLRPMMRHLSCFDTLQTWALVFIFNLFIGAATLSMLLA